MAHGVSTRMPPPRQQSAGSLLQPGGWGTSTCASRLRAESSPADDTAVPKREQASKTKQAAPFRIYLALAVLNLVVFGAVSHFEFVNWDDPTYILENANVLKGLTWGTARWAITTGYAPYWHPVTWLSHLLDVSLFGLDAGAHHVTNLLLHIANTLLVFAVLRRMTEAKGSSAFVAAMFAVHPLHVESVAWVAERKDVLSTFFWALTIWSYISFVRRRTVRWYAAVIAFFLLALMSKPMVVTLPAVLLLLDFWPLRRSGWRLLLVEKIPLVVMSAVTSVATVLIQN